MRSTLLTFVILFTLVLPILGQDGAASGPPKRSLFGRMLHPFSSSVKVPNYKDPKIRGLVLDLRVAPQPVKLSETRQLEVNAILSNLEKRPFTLDFPTDQRIEIYLRNPAEMVLTKWSDNHVAKETPGTLIINPDEKIEYKESIATRELVPNKVYIVEVFFPKYPELRARAKFMTAP
jgi:Intracellular proteinase inhibitor